VIQVLLVDDHELMRRGMPRLLQDAADVEGVAQARTGEEALHMAREHNPDVILMDINMPGMGGIEATRRVKRASPDAKIIGVSVHTDGAVPAKMLETGAAGYLSTYCTPEEAMEAIRVVYRGANYVSADVAQNLVTSGMDGTGSVVKDLTGRELQVLTLLTKAFSLAEIAKKLCLSPSTVSTYRTRIYSKLNVTTDVELTHIALRAGLIEAQSGA